MSLRLTAEGLDIPFNYSFRHASATRDRTSSILVSIRDDTGRTGYGEGCPRPYVTGEQVDTALVWIQQWRAEWERELCDLAALQAWASHHVTEIDAHPSAWCAVELALLDLFAQQRSCDLETLLSLEPLRSRFRYTAVIGDQGPRGFRQSLRLYAWAGMRDLKIKLSGKLERDRDKIDAIQRAFGERDSYRLRVDVNNLWADPTTAIDYLRALSFRFDAIEEPLRARDVDGMERIAMALDCAIVLDESCVRKEDLELFRGRQGRWIPNLRVSKMGGLQRTLEIAEACLQRDLSFVIGAQVGETSLLARAALTVASQAGESALAQEGAFGPLLLKWDPFSPTIAFGYRGQLTLGARTTRRPGIGLERRRTFLRAWVGRWTALWVLVTVYVFRSAWRLRGL